MPAVVRMGDTSTGHACFPPTNLVATPVQKTYFNGARAAVVDSACYFAPHVCGVTVHPIDIRNITKGASKTNIEGKPAARIGDPIACGDACSEGSSNSFIE
jgi:uncharacterized Zn-binding protein involved in type VI secretion